MNNNRVKLKTERQIIFIIVIFLMIFSKIANCDQSNLGLSNKKLSENQIQNFRQKLRGITLKGKWLSIVNQDCKFFQIPKKIQQKLNNQQTNLLTSQSFFKNTNSGQIQGYFWRSDQTKDNLFITLFKNRYNVDQKIQFNINLQLSRLFQMNSEDKYDIFPQFKQGNEQIKLYKQQQLIMTVNLYDGRHELIKYDITCQIQISISKYRFLQLIQSNSIGQDIQINLRVLSQSMSFKSQLLPASYSFVVQFLLFACILQISSLCWSGNRSSNELTNNQHSALNRKIMSRISEWYLLHVYQFNIFVGRIYITQAISQFDTQIGYLIYLGLFNLMIGLFMLRKYQIVFVKFKNKLMFFKFILYCIVYPFLTNIGLYDSTFWIFDIAFIMNLQIYHSIKTGGKGGLPYDLLAFSVISRIPMLYFLIDSDNIFRITPLNTSSIILLIVTFIGHFYIIQLQKNKGGRFFIPNWLIPDYYNYYYYEDKYNQKMKQDCPICYVAINKDPTDMQDTSVNIQQNHQINSLQNNQQHHEQNQQSNTQITQSMYSQKIVNNDKIDNNKNNEDNKIKYMKTPCNHIFHIKCLTDWMQAKLVCPNCRRQLPQLSSLVNQ